MTKPSKDSDQATLPPGADRPSAPAETLLAALNPLVEKYWRKRISDEVKDGMDQQPLTELHRFVEKHWRERISDEIKKGVHRRPRAGR